VGPGENYYPAEGIAYGKRTDTMYGYIKPRGQIFSQEGQSLFPRPGVSIWGALALANSCIYSLHANYVAGQHKYHNYLNKICLPTREIPTDSIRAKKAHELLRAIDLANENTHLFVCPKHRPEFQLERSADQRATVAERLLSAVDELRAEIDRILQNSLHFQNREVRNRRVDYYSHYFGDSFSPHLVGSTWVTYALGTAFGRWDIRFATGEKTAPELPDPFAPLPICPPGQLQNEQGLPITREDVIRLKEEGRWNYPLEIPWDGILVDDPGHPLDIEARVHQVLQIIWQDRWEAIEREACELLGVHTLRDYFRKPAGFFADHLKRYSKSRRKAPIYWPLQTPSGSYTLWLYYHRLNDQTLYTCVNDFVEKAKLREVTEQLDVLRTKASRSKQEENDLERLLDLEQELKNFRDELLRVAQFWKPNLNDGVQITAAPLWKLFQHKPWQNTLKRHLGEAGEA
jgi:hypothetical protein